MGLLDRLIGRRTVVHPTEVRFTVFGGDDDLEVVGESHYQDALWAICGARVGQRVREPIVAVLVPEPQNPYDENAIAVYIGQHVVGYLDRETAAQYVADIHRLMTLHGTHIALEGVVVGGGYRDHGPGFLGVWLEHDRRDFGGQRAPRGNAEHPAMRTGFTEAWLTDAADDSYDLSWYDDLPDADRPAIAMLRDLLASDPDPIDRHFQFAELESRLYRCRDLYTSALDEFDEVCRAHDAEMEGICRAFMTKWNKIPLLETYRQMAIRQQKKKDWQECLAWTERGLSLYGEAAAREDAVEDLQKRRNRALTKLEQAARPEKPKVVARLGEITLLPSAVDAPAPARSADLEVLVCTRCGSEFERLRVRGRKPRFCPHCSAS
ncbi:HIRAN domain-containing protein [Kribbella pittospori]|nr:HIRAN domain-containing protein [Kribbella pittospori]